MNDLNVSPGPDDRAFIFAVVRRIVANEDAANDATQDALLVAYRFRDRFRGESTYRTWLYRIAVNAALGSLRRQRRMHERVADVALPEVVDPADSPETCVANRELAGAVTAAVAGLEPIYRDVIELRAEEVGEREIARRLGISVANVKIRAHRARQHLRGIMLQAPPASRAHPDSRADNTATRRAS